MCSEAPGHEPTGSLLVSLAGFKALSTGIEVRVCLITPAVHKGPCQGAPARHAQTQVLPSVVLAAAHLRDQRAAGISGITTALQDPLRSSLPDMKLGPRALTCNHMMHYDCYLTYSCDVSRRLSARLSYCR